ncbi:hypothetical protein [Nocardioides sp. 1609]|uniref:hypothetical protein n=1 Tax=Nocardioides sp. 1609 TaxID=2508327 RepID=UPI00106F43E9|nr:hypothetical protein [Nocardioides sp. 1609]
MDVEGAAHQLLSLCDDIWRSWTRHELNDGLRDELVERADALPRSKALDYACDVAVFRTVFLATYDTAVEDSLREAADLDEAVPGVGALYLEASIDGSAAVNAWEDLVDYGVSDSEDVVRRTFRQRWVAAAETRPEWPSYTAAAVALLASPQCDALLHGIEPPETIIQFWLRGGAIAAAGSPDPGWRLTHPPSSE